MGGIATTRIAQPRLNVKKKERTKMMTATAAHALDNGERSYINAAAYGLTKKAFTREYMINVTAFAQAISEHAETAAFAARLKQKLTDMDDGQWSYIVGMIPLEVDHD